VGGNAAVLEHVFLNQFNFPEDIDVPAIEKYQAEPHRFIEMLQQNFPSFLLSIRH